MQLQVAAQNDSIKYFDDTWKETSRDSASYYRLVEKKELGYHVRDYYLNGTLQMEGDYTSLEPEIQQGYFVWYFENGQKFVEGTYVRGQREGIWTFWYPDGLKKQEIKFLKDGEYVNKWRSKREKNSIELIEKAVRKMTKGKADDAESLLKAAIANNPYSAEGYYEMGRLKGLTGNKELACQCLKKAKAYGFYDNESMQRAMGKYCE